MNTTTIGTDPAPTENRRSAGEQDMALMREYMAHALKKSYQQRMLAQLSPQVRKRICALRKIQLETTHLEAEFHRMVYDLERKHQQHYDLMYEKRKNIISGDYNPTEDECDFPEPPADPTMQFLNLNEPADNVDDNAVANIEQQGVPNFWLNILKYVPMFESMVKDADEPLLKHLQDIRVTIEPLPGMSFTLEFVFSPNDYFENTVLTKAYFMKCEPDDEAPFNFDGPEIYKSTGCDIRWKDGHNLTQKLVKQKSPDSGHPKMLSSETFFNFFNPPELPMNEDDKDYDEINAALETDFEIGHYLKERIVPRAVLYFTGEHDDDLESDEASPSSSEDSVVDENEEERQWGGDIH